MVITSQKQVLLLVLIGCPLLVIKPVSAAEWTTTAGVAPGVVYTDNVCLEKDDKQGEWIATATPDISLTGNGRRANVSLAGSVEVNSLSNSRLDNLGCTPSGFGGDREQFAPQLRGAADAILVEEWLFINTSVNVDQNETNAFRSGGGDSLDRTGNTNTTYRYDVNPYVQRRFKDAADLLLSYTYSDEYNSADVVGQNTRNSALATLGNDSSPSAFSWSLQGDYSKIDYDETDARATDTDESELKSAQLNLGYQLNRFWQVNGFYGDEWNDFVSSDDDIDGTYWDAGLRWTPGPRTTIEGGVGNRFYGDTHRYSITHGHKRSEFSLSYSEQLTYDRDIRTLDNSSPGFDDPLNPTTLSNSPILDERLTLTYSYQGRRTLLGANASHSDQTRAEDGRDTTFKRASISINRDLARRLSVSAQVSWSEEEPKGERSDFINESETWRGSLGVQKQITSGVDLSLNYDYTDRQSDSVFNEYTENRITLTLRINLL